jgi:hypothetical protein
VSAADEELSSSDVMTSVGNVLGTLAPSAEAFAPPYMYVEDFNSPEFFSPIIWAAALNSSMLARLPEVPVVDSSLVSESTTGGDSMRASPASVEDAPGGDEEVAPSAATTTGEQGASV